MRLGNHETLIEYLYNLCRDTNSVAYQIYNANLVVERHRHRYEVNPELIDKLSSGGLNFSGKDKRTG